MFLHQFGVILASSFSVLSAFPVGFLGGICAFLGHFCVSEALFFEDRFCAALAEPQCCTKLFFKNTCPSELLKQIQRRYSLDAFPPPTSYPLPPLTLPEKPQNPHSSADGGMSNWLWSWVWKTDSKKTASSKDLFFFPRSLPAAMARDLQNELFFGGLGPEGL